MTGFKPGSSGVGGDHSAIVATTTTGLNGQQRFQFQFIFSALAWKPFSFEFFWQELHFVAYLMGVLWKQSIAA